MRIIEKAGAWFSYNNSKIGQGRDNAKKFLEENPLIMEEIRQKVLKKHGILDADVPASINTQTGEIEEKGNDDDRDNNHTTKKTKKNVQ